MCIGSNSSTLYSYNIEILDDSLAKCWWWWWWWWWWWRKWWWWQKRWSPSSPLGIGCLCRAFDSCPTCTPHHCAHCHSVLSTHHSAHCAQAFARQCTLLEYQPLLLRYYLQFFKSLSSALTCSIIIWCGTSLHRCRANLLYFEDIYCTIWTF